MKIKKLSFVNHPVLGSIDFDFCDQTGVPFSTIIIAGANGTGKTLILEAIFQLFGGIPKSDVGTISAEVALDDVDVTLMARALQTYESFVRSDPSLSYNVLYNSKLDDNLGSYDIKGAGVEAGESSVGVNLRNENWGALFRCFYSAASVDFTPEETRNVGSLQLDASKQFSQKSAGTLATEITQLLTDLTSADALDLQLWAEKNKDKTYGEAPKDTRISRFSNAFERIFPDKKYAGVLPDQKRFTPKFQEFGKLTDISDLSTGEKQIVFRSGFLLRNLKLAQGAVILVDEPELSLHPEWQNKIIEFYSALVSNTPGMRAQIFAATHSPFIVHGTPNAKTIILQKSTVDGKISEMIRPSFPTPGAPALRTAFNIDSFIDAAQRDLLVLVEGDTDKIIVLNAWDKLRPGIPRIFDVTPSLGDRNTNITLADRTLPSKLGRRKVIGIFDFDSAYAQWKGLWKKDPSSKIVQNDETLGLCKKRDGAEA